MSLLRQQSLIPLCCRTKQQYAFSKPKEPQKKLSFLRRLLYNDMNKTMYFGNIHSGEIWEGMILSERCHFSMKPDRKKGLLGLIIAACFFLIFMLGYGSWVRGSAFFVLFAATGFVKLDFPKKRENDAAYWVWTLLCMVFLVLFPYYEIYEMEEIK